MNQNPEFTKNLILAFNEYENDWQPSPSSVIPVKKGQRFGYWEKQQNALPPHPDMKHKLKEDEKKSTGSSKPKGGDREGHGKMQFGVHGASGEHDAYANQNQLHRVAFKPPQRRQRPWHKSDAKKDDKQGHKKGFDASKFKVIEKWSARLTDQGDDFEKYMKPVRGKAQEQPEASGVPSRSSGNLNIIADEAGFDFENSDSNPTSGASIGADETRTGTDDTDEPDCVVCMCPMDDPMELTKCRHTFCRDCITGYFRMKSTCPICGTVYGSLQGDQPVDGTATVYEDKTPLPGYSCATMIISYEFQDGKQEVKQRNNFYSSRIRLCLFLYPIVLQATYYFLCKPNSKSVLHLFCVLCVLCLSCHFIF